MTVFRPSFPPYRVINTRVRASAGLSCQLLVLRISARVYAPPPATSAVAPTTPERSRNFRRVSRSMPSSSADRVLGAGEAQGEQLRGVLAGGRQDRPGPVGEPLDPGQ